MPNQPCYDQGIFSRFLDEQVNEHEEAKILTHIASCDKCRGALERLAGNKEVLEDIQQHLADQDIGLGMADTQDVNAEDSNRDLRKVKDLLAPTDDPKMLGRLGGYEVLGVIGRGSAGIVVKALDTRLNRFVAIKLLAPAYSNNGCSRRRFEREGRAIASVKDPHVVPIHSVDEFQGTPYIVMQYMPDGSLYQRIQKKGPLSTNEVVCIGMQVAKGLAAAHDRGIVHRDVKPANVLLENGVDNAMVTDFGLARVVDEATMTRSGSISGTPQYMSPEQAMGERVDPRSDLFSLGSVMYAASTGHAPFKSESVFGVIKKVCDSDPKPILEFNPDIDAWLVAFIERLQSKQPDQRFESADEVANFLSQELAHMQNPAMVAQPTRDWWHEKKITKPVKPTKQSSSANKRSRTKTMAFAMVAIAALAIGGFGFGAFDGLLGSSNSGGWLSFLSPVQDQEEKELPRFENTVETTIDVKDGGALFLKTNFGSVDVKTHDKETVEMHMLQIVESESEDTANRIFAATTMTYDASEVDMETPKIKKGRDAIIVAEFPNKPITEKEIKESEDFEQLKNRLLVHNHPHFRSAKFELLIPKQFNLELSTDIGKIRTSDVDGWVKLSTKAGEVVTGNVSDMVEVETKGGNITLKDLGDDAIVMTKGGSIDIGNIEGSVAAETKGGDIYLGHVKGGTVTKTGAGRVKVWKTNGEVNVQTGAGGIDVNFVGQPKSDSVFKTGAGSIKIGMTEGLAFDIDARCNLGSVSGPFVEGKATKFLEKINDGKVKLVASTPTGSISFRNVNADELVNDRHAERQRSIAQTAFQAAYDLHMDGKLDEAIEAHKAAAKFDSHKGIATYNLGCAWALKEDKEKAFEALSNAIDFGFNDKHQFKFDDDLNSLRDDERFNKLIARLEKASAPDDAMAELEEADSIEVEDFGDRSKGQEVFQHAYDLHMEGKLDEAIEAHKAAAKFDSYKGIATYNLGCAWALKGEKDKAFKALFAAVKYGFADQDQFETDTDLDTLREDERFDDLMEAMEDSFDDSDEDSDKNSDEKIFETSLRIGKQKISKTSDESVIVKVKNSCPDKQNGQTCPTDCQKKAAAKVKQRLKKLNPHRKTISSKTFEF